MQRNQTDSRLSEWKAPLLSVNWILSCVELPAVTRSATRASLHCERPTPSPGKLVDPRIESDSLVSPVLATGFLDTSITWEAQIHSAGLDKHIYKNIHPPLQDHTGCCYCPKSPQCSTCSHLFSLTLATTGLLTVSIVLPFPEWQSWNHTICTVTDCILGALKSLWVDDDCSHEIKRRLLLGKKLWPT